MGKKKLLAFNRRGGTVAFDRAMLGSPAYESMNSRSKTLMTLLQMHWRNNKTIDYGIREAKKKIPCSDKSASKAFEQLQERGFITCTEESSFSSRTQSKSRSWRLNWMPFNDKSPSNEWEAWTVEN